MKATEIGNVSVIGAIEELENTFSANQVNNNLRSGATMVKDTIVKGVKAGMTGTHVKFGEVKVTAVEDQMISVVPRHASEFTDGDASKTLLAYSIQFKNKKVKYVVEGDDAPMIGGLEAGMPCPCCGSDLVEVEGKVYCSVDCQGEYVNDSINNTNGDNIENNNNEEDANMNGTTIIEGTTNNQGGNMMSAAEKLLADVNVNGGGSIEVKTDGNGAGAGTAIDRTPSFTLSIPSATIALSGTPWYMEEIEGVTGESANTSLAISKIGIEAPFAGQDSMLCRVNVRLIDGTLLRGIKVLNSSKGAFLASPSTPVERDANGKVTKWFDMFHMTKEFRAQVLRYCHVNEFKAPARNSQWYLGEVSTTTEAREYALVPEENIKLSGVKESQLRWGIVGKASINYGAVIVYGITIRASKNNDGSMYLGESNISYTKAGEAKATYFDITKLSIPTKAQVLRKAHGAIRFNNAQ